MATIAVIAAGNVLRGLAAGHGGIMATDATAIDFGMVNRAIGHRSPGRREYLMAGITVSTGADVGRRLTTGGITIVAAEAIVHKVAVIRGAACDRQPGGGDMTNITLLGGDNMVRPFTPRQDSVMAFGTQTDSLTMIGGTGRQR